MRFQTIIWISECAPRADHEFSQHKSDTGTFPEQNNPDTVTSPEADQSAVCAINRHLRVAGIILCRRSIGRT